jgi:hypothetical protein
MFHSGAEPPPKLDRQDFWPQKAQKAQEFETARSLLLGFLSLLWPLSPDKLGGLVSIVGLS